MKPGDVVISDGRQYKVIDILHEFEGRDNGVVITHTITITVEEQLP